MDYEGKKVKNHCLEGLDSSLAQSAAQLWLAKVYPERANYTFFETLDFVKNRGFEP